MGTIGRLIAIDNRKMERIIGCAPFYYCKLNPAFDDDFALSIKLNRVHTLTVQIAEERVLLPTEGEGSRRRSHTDVDTDVTGIDAVLEFAGMSTVVGEDAGGVTVLAAVDDLDSAIQIVSLHHGENGAKDLFLR